LLGSNYLALFTFNLALLTSYLALQITPQK
jgi:hypothetical protein